MHKNRHVASKELKCCKELCLLADLDDWSGTGSCEFSFASLEVFMVVRLRTTFFWYASNFRQNTFIFQRNFLTYPMFTWLKFPPLQVKLLHLQPLTNNCFPFSHYCGISSPSIFASASKISSPLILHSHESLMCSSDLCGHYRGCVLRTFLNSAHYFLMCCTLIIHQHTPPSFSGKFDGGNMFHKLTPNLTRLLLGTMFSTVIAIAH